MTVIIACKADDETYWGVDSMDISDLYNMPLRNVLTDYCIVYSPECDYYYGVTKWDDALQMETEFDLEDEYCFAADSLIPLHYGIEDGVPILTHIDLRRQLDYLGIKRRRGIWYEDLWLRCNAQSNCCGKNSSKS